MDVGTFVVEMTKALAWPVLLVVAILVLRDPVAKLLTGLRTARYKTPGREVEVAFGDASTEKIDEKLAEVARGPGLSEQPYGSDDSLRLEATIVALTMQLAREVTIVDNELQFSDGTRAPLTDARPDPPTIAEAFLRYKRPGLSPGVVANLSKVITGCWNRIAKDLSQLEPEPTPTHPLAHRTAHPGGTGT
jgi:hypothetical protein